MSETTPETTAPIEGGPAPSTDNARTEEKRYAAYDDTYLRFIPGVYASKKDATAAAKAAKAAKFSIREV